MDNSNTRIEQKHRRASEAVYDAMIGRFISGELRPGTRLPSEDCLAGEFSVSRPTVRKVLFRLRSEGYIMSRRGAGSFAIGRTAPIAGDMLTNDAFESCMVFRQAIEPGCAALLAERCSDEELAQLADCNAELESAAHRNDLAAFEAADFGFHQLLARLSGNAYFAGAITQHAYMIRCTQRAAPELPPGPRGLRFSEIISEHAEILSAIRKRSSVAASEAMKQHLTNARLYVRHAQDTQS